MVICRKCVGRAVHRKTTERIAASGNHTLVHYERCDACGGKGYLSADGTIPENIPLKTKSGQYRRVDPTLRKVTEPREPETYYIPSKAG